MTIAEQLPMHSSKNLTIGIVGFGNFGQFLGRFFAKQGHRVVGVSRGDYAAAAAAIGCEYVRKNDDLMDTNPDVVIFCTSIMSLDTVLERFPLERLSGVLVADVLSVKMYPHDLLLKCLPDDADIVCTHPMFGPESGRDSWKDLPFVYDVVRVDPSKKQRCNDFLSVWSAEQCKMIEMNCSEHDAYAASSQFITHTTGRMLDALRVESTPINTRGYESLLGVVDTTKKDSFDLFYGLYKYNPNARSELDNLEAALKQIRKKLEAREAVEAAKTEKYYQHASMLSLEVLENLMLRANAKV